MNNEEQYVLYILMRTDLPSMNVGKAMAQASHASNAFMHKVKKDFDMCPTSVKAVEWEKQTSQGFGTVLVLGATSDDIMGIDSNIRQMEDDGKRIHTRWVFEKVVDPTYPYIVNSEIAGLIDKNVHTGESPIELESGDCLCLRNEVTCAYLFADKNNEQIKELLGELTLHP
jgi:peptidyl-tRNA hydrolase